MLFVGYFLGIVWLDTLVKPSVISLSCLYLGVIFLIYIPANNQIFQNGEATIAALYFGSFIVLRELRYIGETFEVRKRKTRRKMAQVS